MEEGYDGHERASFSSTMTYSRYRDSFTRFTKESRESRNMSKQRELFRETGAQKRKNENEKN